MADQDEARFSMIRYEVDSDRGVATLTLCNARRGGHPWLPACAWLLTKPPWEPECHIMCCLGRVFPVV